MNKWLNPRSAFGVTLIAVALLGVFTMFSSIPFKVVTIALALSIIACTVHRTPNLYAQAMKPHVHVRPTFFDHARTRADAVIDADATDATDTTDATAAADAGDAADTSAPADNAGDAPDHNTDNHSDTESGDS